MTRAGRERVSRRGDVRRAGGARPARERVVALVPAGGIGARMGAGRPKQYLALGGAPILVRTLRALGRSRAIGSLVVAVPEAWLPATEGLLRRHRVAPAPRVVAGGAHRQESVWRALQAAPADAALVVVHDAVRPFIEPALVRAVIAAAARTGAATCALPARETVKRVRDGLVEATLDRESLWLVQTPQAFRRALLSEAHDKARRDGFVGTDDAALVERLGAAVAVVPGLRQNVKITTPEDLALARRFRTGARR